MIDRAARGNEMLDEVGDVRPLKVLRGAEIAARLISGVSRTFVDRQDPGDDRRRSNV